MQKPKPILELPALLLLATIFALLAAGSLVLAIRASGIQAHFRIQVLFSTLPGAILATSFWYAKHWRKNFLEIKWTYPHSLLWGLVGWAASVIFLMLYSFTQPEPFTGGAFNLRSGLSTIYGIAALGLLFGLPAILFLMPVAMFLGQAIIKRIRK